MPATGLAVIAQVDGADSAVGLAQPVEQRAPFPDRRGARAGRPPAQATSVLAKTCQASADLATRLSRM